MNPRLAWGIVLSALLSAFLPGGARAAQRGYDEDPIRVGNKALQEMRLEDARASFQDAIQANYQVGKAKYGLAEIMMRQGRKDQAEQLYREAIDASARAGEKSFPEAYAALGLLQIDSNRWDEGAKNIMTAYQQNQGYWPAIYGQALLQLRGRKWDKAKAYLDWGARRKGVPEGEDLYHHGMALYYMGQGDMKNAEIEALKAFHMNLVDPSHARLVAQIYEKRNVPALAIAACEEILNSPNTQPSASFVHFAGTLYQKAGRYNDARDRYLQAVKIDSTYAPALKDLAALLHLANQNDRAAQTYLRYVELEPKDVDAMVALVECLNAGGRYVQALDAANRAMAIDSTRAAVRVAYARAAIHSRDRAVQARAVEVYSALPDSLALTADDHVLIAGYLTDTQQIGEAREHLVKAIAADSTSADAYFQMGLLAFKSNSPDSASAFFREAVRHDGKVPLYYLNLGIAYFQTKRYEQSTAAFRRAIAIDKRPVLGHVLLAQALVAVDSVETAEAEYHKALDLDPKNGRALRGLGFCALRRSAFDEAVTAYKSATQSEPNSSDGWAGLGQAYLGLRDWASAENAFRKAQSLDPGNATARKGLEVIAGTKHSSGG